MPQPSDEPPLSSFWLPDPRSAGRDDVVAIGADLEPGTILQAYRRGMFPMHLAEGPLAWWSPATRGVLIPDQLKISRSLARSSQQYRTTTDVDFEGVIDGCADPSRPSGWIQPDIRVAYLELHSLGWAHSIEAWSSDGELAGGLYGVSIGGLFAGESMFYRQRDASKVALVELSRRVKRVPDSLIDVQWASPHLMSLGVTEMSRDHYLRRLASALDNEQPDDLWSN